MCVFVCGSPLCNSQTLFVCLFTCLCASLFHSYDSFVPFLLSVHNTLCLEVHCPIVKPALMLVSDHGRPLLDFANVSIGKRSYILVQNLTEFDPAQACQTYGVQHSYLTFHTKSGSLKIVVLHCRPIASQEFHAAEHLGWASESILRCLAVFITMIYMGW